MHLITNLGDVAALRQKIVDDVAQRGFTSLRGLISRTEIAQCLVTINEYANTREHLASSGVSPAQIRQNMSKWSIGGQSTSQSNLARFMLTIYNPLFQEDMFGLHKHFETLIDVRDILIGRARQKDEDLMPSRFNACRLQIYPAGGGFMGAHTDSRAEENLQKGSGPYIQLVMLLTEKGRDYQQGGAFVMKDEQFVDTESTSQAGDILVYDGSTMHGVADIDPAIRFNTSDLKGRVVALATIYNYK
ncbi:hypothetical protein [Pseudomonas trivialis]|uniref:hypothetical protein n=1 Tax=Pseudomonas trivialis TaxID=200450 RepID=UPI0030D0EEDF